MESLKSKVTLILLEVFILSATFSYAIQQLIVYPSFFSLEQNEGQKELDRCVPAIKRELFHLEKIRIISMDLGGNERRKILFHTGTGEAFLKRLRQDKHATRLVQSCI